MSQPSKPASLSNRVLAFGYDYLLISAYLIALGLVTIVVMKNVDAEVWDSFFSSPLRSDLVAFLVSVLPVALYFARMESSEKQASWGKTRRQLKVMNANGERLSFGTALIRSFLKLLPWQIAHTCLFNIPDWPMNPGTPPTWVMVGLSLVWIIVLGYALSIAARRSRQSIYDQILRIQVVETA